MIEGRIKALANVHSLFVEARWIGAELSAVATQELAPYFATGDERVHLDGPQVMLEPSTAQAVAVTLHELATNAAKYGSLSAVTLPPVFIQRRLESGVRRYPLGW